MLHYICEILYNAPIIIGALQVKFSNVEEPTEMIRQSSRRLERAEMRRMQIWYMMIAAVVAMMLTTNITFAADDIFQTIQEAIEPIYAGIFGVSTGLAVLFIAIAAVIRLISHNQRSIDEANAWIKRIIISWLIINLTGSLLTYGQQLVESVGGGMVEFD